MRRTARASRGGLGPGHETGDDQSWTKYRRRGSIHTSAKNSSGIATRNRTWVLMLARNEGGTILGVAIDVSEVSYLELELEAAGALARE